VGGEERWPTLSGVSTIAQAGFADFRSETMQALFAPAGTPAAVVERVNKAVAEALGKAPVRKQLDGLGFRVIASSSAALKARVAQEVPQWAAVAAQAGISAD
jgi:tripartite-type tricarboxylate transporter receptor subunit TctC